MNLEAALNNPQLAKPQDLELTPAHTASWQQALTCQPPWIRRGTSVDNASAVEIIKARRGNASEVALAPEADEGDDDESDFLMDDEDAEVTLQAMRANAIFPTRQLHRGIVAGAKNHNIVIVGCLDALRGQVIQPELIKTALGLGHIGQVYIYS